MDKHLRLVNVFDPGQFSIQDKPIENWKIIWKN